MITMSVSNWSQGILLVGKVTWSSETEEDADMVRMFSVHPTKIPSV